MADDIEDLLREVEEKYLPKSSHQEKNPISQLKSSYPTVIQIEKRSHGGDQSVAAGASVVAKTTTRAHSSDIV